MTDFEQVIFNKLDNVNQTPFSARNHKLKHPFFKVQQNINLQSRNPVEFVPKNNWSKV